MEMRNPKKPSMKPNQRARRREVITIPRWLTIERIVVLLTLIGLLVAVITLIVEDASRKSQDTVQATMVAAQATQVALANTQLAVQREIATAQAVNTNSGPTATAAAEKIAQLMRTQEALEAERRRVEAALPTASAAQISGSLPSSTPILLTATTTPGALTAIPITSSSPLSQTIATITSREGETYQVPANLLFYGQEFNNRLLLYDNNTIPFPNMKSFEIDSSSTIVTATIVLLNNETIISQVNNNKLYGPTNNGAVDIYLSEVDRVDFDASPTQPVVFAIALVTPSEGDPTIVPAAFLEGQYSPGSYISPPGYASELRLSNGVRIPFQNMRKFEISPSDQTITITLQDGRVVPGKMGDTFALRGPTDSGTFHLDLKGVKRVEFSW